MDKPLNLDYPAILNVIKPFLIEDRTESHSFLVWFLEHYYRLDETESHDTVCDGFDDKGIDGVYVDENLESIVVFQAKLVQNPKKTLGDTQLKEFVGTLDQFRTPAEINEIANTTANTELSNLLVKEKVADKISGGYAVKGMFVTNIEMDQNGKNYLKGREDLSVIDKSELIGRYIPLGRTPPVSTPVSFDIFGFDCAEYKFADANILMAPLKGSELIGLRGIGSQELFVWNVRGSLGRTKVNKDIGRSIDDSSEHKNFLLYHNGLTILCKQVKRDSDKITIAGYSVVNGCQSLTSLYDHKNKITDDLRIMVRLIELPPDHELAEKVTHHSNNQNSINARDLQSNSLIQRRLQNEFDLKYSQRVFYRIKRGEPEQAPQVIENFEAGRLLLAFDLKQPWTCHQTYKILDELHASIFARPEVNADRILAIAIIHEVILKAINSVEDRPLAAYRLTQYLLLYLVREALELDPLGKGFCQNPGKFLSESKGRERIRTCFAQVAADIVIDLNAEIRDRKHSEKLFDYKRELKSPSAVRELSRSIITPYQKLISSKRAKSFTQEWEDSVPS